MLIYLRNVTSVVQSLVDPLTGVAQTVEPGALVRVTPSLAERVMNSEPGKWARVEPIPL